jgi:hypothetical protein
MIEGVKNLLAKGNLLNAVRFLWHWAYLLLLLIPLVGYFVVLNYYTPQPFHISLQLECQDKQCQFKLDELAIQKVNSNLQDQIDQANRLDKFSIPFGTFINLYPRVTNKSTATLSVSEPLQNLPQQVAITCQLLPSTTEIFSYNSGIVFNNKTSLSQTPDTVKSVVNTLVTCFRGLESSSSNLKVIVAPNGTVSFKDPKVDFLVEFFPDDMSKNLIRVEVLVIFLGLLPLLGVLVRFLVKGWRYFLD